MAQGPVSAQQRLQPRPLESFEKCEKYDSPVWTKTYQNFFTHSSHSFVELQISIPVAPQTATVSCLPFHA